MTLPLENPAKDADAPAPRPVRRVEPPDALLSRAELERSHAVPPALRVRIDETRRAIADVLHGRDASRLVVVVGPCSIHDRGSALEYARRLRDVAARLEDDLIIVMRTYLEKPRSLLGWKGLINDPDLDGSCDVSRGVVLARELLLEIGHLGVPCASELLDPVAAPYVTDLLSWAAIGARTVESQVHRELASRCPVPVGMKNNLEGDVEAAVRGALAARVPHAALGVADSGRIGILRSGGNPDAHVVLRGGRRGPNHTPQEVARASRHAEPLGLSRPLLIDCSHGNSDKDASRQPGVCRKVLEQVRVRATPIAGVLLESHLTPGRQAWEPSAPAAPDCSITDACMGWQETRALLEEAAMATRRQR